MSEQQLVTVFRSAYATAEEEAEQVCDALVEAGLTAVVLDDSEPGIFEGTWEVRVPSGQVPEAEQLLAAMATEPDPGEPGEELDLVPLFEVGTELTEIEAMSLQTLLEANGIPVVVISGSQMPNLLNEVRVPRELLEEAERIVREAAETGEAAAAAEAEPPAQA
jgi:ribosomal protein L11 methylase PrmA